MSDNTATDYIRACDDEDGVVLVDDSEGVIESFAYSCRDERGVARKAAKKLAEMVARERGCDWGCNY